MAASMDSSCMLQAYGPALNGAVPECTGTPQCNTCVLPRGAAERLTNKRLASRELCDREQRGARPIDTVCAVAVVAQVENHMLLIVGAVIVLSAVVIIPRMRVPDGVNASTLGWMSDKWLAEHRASHSR